jgi:hypothetical protein
VNDPEEFIINYYENEPNFESNVVKTHAEFIIENYNLYNIDQ